MKYCLLWVTLMFVAGLNGNAQNVQAKQRPNAKLTALNRKYYVLSINERKMRCYDSVYTAYPYKHQINARYFSVPITLTNNSPQVLSYLSMSCGWDEFYLIDNDSFHHTGIPCDKNVPVNMALAPHQSATVWFSVYTAKNGLKNNSFRIGMIIKKGGNPFFNNRRERKDKQDVIWSNPVKVSTH
ncbi:hypothetical protein BDD43_2677 [Mucilaginibacter gracilis]|uniref:Uncharacterized protein n=1 Tax=Mucilaginibacter gracilis TaxID=423350 RepID=A0A495J2D3_9SPHI|nr:hypothetical protein [Mucilaginibacter gracilis]RKR82494.1 hypothetical protein BDD43_2677 [Mucilaginibacter gracilis]